MFELHLVTIAKEHNIMHFNAGQQLVRIFFILFTEGAAFFFFLGMVVQKHNAVSSTNALIFCCFCCFTDKKQWC